MVKDKLEESCLLLPALCPVCGMPFEEKGKKRRLVDQCGHERCYSCLLKSDQCPVCATQAPPKKILQCSRASLSDDRPKLITNGTFSPIINRGLNDPGLPPALQPRRAFSPSRSPPTLLPRAPSPFAKSVGGTPSSRRKGLSFPWSKKASESPQHLTDEEPECDRNKGAGVGKGDLYVRLGLLLGESASRNESSSHTSFSSLSTSSDANAGVSNSASPASTLTGSSEIESQQKDLTVKSPFTTLPKDATLIAGRRHSVTTCQPGQVEDLSIFKRHETYVRRSARSGRSNFTLNRKAKDMLYSRNYLNLRPLFFEVPQQDPDPIFIGRSWLFRDVYKRLTEDGSTNQGVIISGNIGSGKTAVILQMVYSSTSNNYISLIPDGIHAVASRVVAYHFCQAENSPTCLVPDFIHSIAAQLCQAPQLIPYREYILSDHKLQELLLLSSCICNPTAVFIQGILEPLHTLRRQGKLGSESLFLLIDGLCDAEVHRPDNADTIASFVSKHITFFPSFLKVIVTVRTQFEELTHLLPFSRISLDPYQFESTANSVTKDLTDFITFRCCHSPTIRNNIALTQDKLGGTFLTRFTHHLVIQSKGSMLYIKLILDLVERGHLIMKSSSFRVLPHNLAETFLLMFNLKFPSLKSFEKVQPILNIVLASLNPLTLPELYNSVNSGLLYKFLTWDEFLSRLKILNNLLIKRLDDTYMLFHPALREWLSHRTDRESSKFLCEPRQGHAALALRLSRLEWPLDAEATLELGHHILKAHIYKNMSKTLPVAPRDLQALWLAQSSSDVSSALTYSRNLYSPNTKVSRLLFLAGASPDQFTEHINEAPILGMCSYLGHTEMVCLLIEFGANIDIPNREGITPLGLSSLMGHCDIVHFLVQAGASRAVKDKNKHTPLSLAANAGNLSVVQYLLTCKAPSKGYSKEEAIEALVYASQKGHIEVVQYLMDTSAVCVDDTDSVSGETSLTMTCTWGHATLVEFLLRSGANATKCNANGSSSLSCAVQQGHYELVKLLLDKGFPVETNNVNGKTPLMVAASEGHVGLMELLTSKGASHISVDKDGLSPLSWACIQGHIHAVHYLVDRGADVNHVDRSGRTPLDLAAYQGDPYVVQFLLDRGALVEHVDANGMRPLDRAISANNVHAVQCFLRKGAKLGPATWSMAFGKLNIMLILLNKLQEDGVTLCRKGRLKEAAHRFIYAIRKLPAEQDLEDMVVTFQNLKLHLLLNLSRCKRKMNEIEEALQLANQALEIKPDSYEAYYARARAEREKGMVQEAVSDVEKAICLAPLTAREVRRVLVNIRNEMTKTKLTCELSKLRNLTSSVDNLTEQDIPSTASFLSESGYSSNF